MKIVNLSIVIILGLIFCVLPTSVSAAGASTYGKVDDCQPVYGAPCSSPSVVVVDKKVRNPATGIFVDNLTVTDPHYKPEQIITFQITLKNSGDKEISHITVTDIFPVVKDQPVIDFMSGPGEYNKDDTTMKMVVKDLKPNMQRSFEIKGRIRHAATLPWEGTLCPKPGNRVTTVINGQNQTDEDEAQFCIDKGTPQVKAMATPVQRIPDAGPQDWLLLWSTLGTAGIGGLYLRRYTSPRAV